MPPNKIIAACLSVTLLAAGCATPSSEISTLYISVEQYSAYNCNQIDDELRYMQTRVDQLTAQLDKAAASDRLLLGFGLVVWPLLFALGGTKDQEAEYAYTKGKYERMRELAEAKKCPGSFAVALAYPANLQR